jgi:hypothetical protein
MENIEQLTNEEIQSKMVVLNEKYQKLLKLAMKLAKEMDNLSDEYNVLKTEIDRRRNN